MGQLENEPENNGKQLLRELLKKFVKEKNSKEEPPIEIEDGDAPNKPEPPTTT